MRNWALALVAVLAIGALGAVPSNKRVRRAGVVASGGTAAVPYASTLAYEFNGVDERINFGNVTTADGATRLKIALWIRWVSGSQGWAIARRDTSQRQFGLLVLASGQIRFYAAQSPAADTFVASNTLLTPGVWTHVVADYDISEPLDHARFIINGVDDGGLGGSLGSINNLSTPSAATSLYIADSSISGPLATQIAHPAIWVGANAAAMVESEVYGGATNPLGAPNLNSLATTPAPNHWWPANSANMATVGGVRDLGSSSANGTGENTDATNLILISSTLPATYYAVILTGSSYGHEGGGTLQTPPILVDAGISDGAVNAWQVIDASVVAAVERAGIAPAIQAFRTAAASSGQQWVLIDYETPGVGLDSLAADTTPLLANISAAAAWAASRTAEICPVAYFDISWSYYAEAGSLSYASMAATIATVKGDVETRLASLVGAGIKAGCTSLVYHDLIGAHPGSGSTALVRGPYAAEYLANYTGAPMFSTFHLPTQAPPDGTHLTSAGGVAFGYDLGRAFLWAQTDGTADRFVPTGVSVVDGTTVDVTYTVPCRSNGDCATNPPLVVDTTNQVAQVTQGGAATLGLHFFSGGSLVAPSAVSVATPQTCDPPATTCTVRYTFSSGLPSFDEVQVGNVYCHDSADTNCFSGPTATKSGGNNVRMQVSSLCPSPPCSVAPGAGSFSTSYDAGVSVDAGFAHTNTQYLSSTPGNYISTANQGGQTTQCVFLKGPFPTTSNETLFRPNTSLRFFMGQLGGTPGCAISGSPLTYRVASGSYSIDGTTWYDMACCYNGGAVSNLTVFINGTDVSGTTSGSATSLDTDTVTHLPDNNSPMNPQPVDEVIVLPGKGTLTAGELLQLRCATKAAADTSPTAGECSGVVTDISAICALATGTRWYPLDGNGNDLCGTLNGSSVGTPAYGSR